MFVSGSDDGTARHFDMRESIGCQDAYGLRTGDIIGEEVAFLLGHLPACNEYNLMQVLQLANNSISVSITRYV